jgi:hypothetical protein
MKTNLKRTLTVAAFAIAAGLLASPLSAAQGKFNLPFEAHWGNAVLAPGSYKISGPSVTSPVGILYIYGNGKTQMAVPAMTEIRGDSDHSYLRLVNVGGTYVVREFVSGATGRNYTFGIPKTLRLHMTQQKEHEVATVLDVTGN